MARTTYRNAGVLYLLAAACGAQLLCGGAIARAAVEPGGPAAPARATASAVVAGYLPTDTLIDSVALLGPAPEKGSPAEAFDTATTSALQHLRATPRGKVAARDAVYAFPHAVDAFSCAIGVRISAQSTPNLNTLLRRTLVDASKATAGAKERYSRARPYVVAGGSHTCYPPDEAGLRHNGSYPSGHAAFGWAWALILTEALPSRADAIVKRGYEFGQSRVICGYHWQSDVNAGRLIGAAVVAQLHNNPEFRDQLEAARHEIAVARAAGGEKPDCSIDNAADIR